jgi:hypothetical protein
VRHTTRIVRAAIAIFADEPMQSTGLESVLAAKRVIEPNRCKRRASLRLAMTPPIRGALPVTCRRRTRRVAPAETRFELVALRGPVSGTTCVAGVSTPRAASRVARQLTGSRSVLVLNSYGCTHCSRACDIASKSYKVRVRNDSIVDVNRKLVRRIACASLCHEKKFPESIKGRPCLR